MEIEGASCILMYEGQRKAMLPLDSMKIFDSLNKQNVLTTRHGIPIAHESEA